MDSDFLIDPKQIRKLNFLKYKGIPPSWDLIESVVKRSRLKRLARFEFIYGIPKDTLTWYKNGIQGLSAKYWHIFYDFDIVNQMYSKLQKKNKPKQKKHLFLHLNNPIIDAQRSTI